jgi:hypothetical protein
MGNVIVGATMSLDGFMNDRHGDVSRLYPDLGALRRTEMLQEEIRRWTRRSVRSSNFVLTYRLISNASSAGLRKQNIVRLFLPRT